MFENEIKFISDFTLNKVKELGSFITVDKILATDIHPSIKKYVEGEIDYLIYEDRKKLIENSLFDYSGKEISNYFNLIGTEIKKTKKISYEDIKNIILQAVSFNANYVARPKWSLSKLIFGNNKSVSVNEIQLMFNYTYYYEYLNNVFLAYLSKKKILNVSVTEFELIVNKIDRELFMLHQSKLVDNALYAIADYFSIGGLNKSSVTIESVEHFLKEKNLTELIFKLKRGYANTGKKKADIDEVRKVLYSTLNIDSIFVEETEKEEKLSDDKHFENPLENEITPDEFMDDEEEVKETSLQDMEKAESTDLSDEKLNVETTQSSDESQFVVSEDEKHDEIIETQIPNMIPDDGIKDDKTPDHIVVLNEEFKETVFEEEGETLNNDLEKIDLMEPVKDETLTEEELLFNLTEEIDKDSNEEIIILDDKEQEDLLNFYDNELEISIDDETDSLKTDFAVTQEAELDSDTNELNLEHELEIKENQDEGISLEKIDFNKDLAPAVTEEKEEQSDNAYKSKLKSRAEDIFSFLSKKEIDKIIKNLFNSDSEDFANTVEKMSECSNYEEASRILDNVFKYARIKPHSKEAAMLKGAVAKFFNVDI
ncbi:MAG: hypothetical protein PHY57_06810 [Ignavibacterium sp.]|jgi:hypothetical protein|nr:hypothetical protein [Ignavibacterium sp.]MDX9711183.1 hypothetical protein [Ignavibacteriaceae bacterium]MEB2355543.1 hypothetical protein [Ignavibacteriales bacterium]GIK20839.1 MAG: hypothetical protein BroJett005_02530 [Ignavibacteriota bacterium]